LGVEIIDEPLVVLHVTLDHLKKLLNVIVLPVRHLGLESVALLSDLVILNLNFGMGSHCPLHGLLLGAYCDTKQFRLLVVSRFSQVNFDIANILEVVVFD